MYNSGVMISVKEMGKSRDDHFIPEVQTVVLEVYLEVWRRLVPSSSP